MDRRDVVVLGAGPAGLSAAIYTARAGLSTLVVDREGAGGQVKTTHQVANYPGFVEPIAGHELAANMHRQAKRYGADFALATDVIDLELTDQGKCIEVEDEGKVAADFVIIATGSSPRLLGIPGEREYRGNGVSYCATCDAEFYEGKDIFVVGGGNSAMEESLLLLKFVKGITVIHQFDELQAEKATVDRVMANQTVRFLWSHEPREFRKQGERMAVEVESLKTGQRTTLMGDGVFVFVGLVPNGDVLDGTPVERTGEGYVVTNSRLQTNVEGVYAAGDVRDKRHRQIGTAVGDGIVAALEVIRKASGP